MHFKRVQEGEQGGKGAKGGGGMDRRERRNEGAWGWGGDREGVSGWMGMKGIYNNNKATLQVMEGTPVMVLIILHTHDITNQFQGVDFFVFVFCHTLYKEKYTYINSGSEVMRCFIHGNRLLTRMQYLLSVIEHHTYFLLI